MSQTLSLSVLPERLAICRLPAGSPIPDWASAAPFFSVSRTDDELSVVAPESHVPADLDHAVGGDRKPVLQSGWRALKVAGPLNFALTGVLASLATPLAEAGVPIFAISTYETDYVLVPGSQFDSALDALRARGHRITEDL